MPKRKSNHATRRSKSNLIAPQFILICFRLSICFSLFPKMTSIFGNPTSENPCVCSFSSLRLFLYTFVYWCPKVESNHRHKDFQSFALPTELSGQNLFLDSTLLVAWNRTTDTAPQIWLNRSEIFQKITSALSPLCSAFKK